MPCRVTISISTVGGASSLSARRRPVLVEALRKAPEMARIFILFYFLQQFLFFFFIFAKIATIKSYGTVFGASAVYFGGRYRQLFSGGGTAGHFNLCR